MTGTLGLLVAAVQSGLLPSLAEALEAAKQSGLYVAPATLAALTKR
jgi:predicted nucleic acid-binding protein